MTFLLVHKLDELQRRSKLYGNKVKRSRSSLARGSLKPDTFFTLSANVQYQFAAIGGFIDRCKTLRSELLVATSQKEEQKVTKELAAITEDLNKSLRSAKAALADVATKVEEETDPEKGESPEHRIRLNVHATLSRRFGEHMRSFQKVQQELLADRREKTSRQLMIALPALSEEEATKLVNDGASAKMAMSERLTCEVGTDKAQLCKRLRMVEDRLTDLRRLEAAMGDMQQFFVELAVAVEKQGEMLESIEHTVINTKNYYFQGRIALAKAKIKQRSALKKKLWLSLCCLILIGILLIAILPYLTPLFKHISSAIKADQNAHKGNGTIIKQNPKSNGTALSPRAAKIDDGL